MALDCWILTAGPVILENTFTGQHFATFGPAADEPCQPGHLCTTLIWFDSTTFNVYFLLFDVLDIHHQIRSATEKNPVQAARVTLTYHLHRKKKKFFRKKL